MIQDIYPHRFGNHFRTVINTAASDFILHYRENAVLLKTNGEQYEIPQRKDFPEALDDQISGVFLFSLDEVPCFLISEELPVDKPGFIYRDISFFRTAVQQEIAWISIAGFQLMNWYAHNKFCGKCGGGMLHKDEERALICKQCNNVVYPRISPAVIAAIICKDKILLARNSKFPGKWYSLIAGYADVGESLEETLVREVKEEVGLDIRNIRYYKSQPWPLSGSIMIGFIAEADESQPITIDGKEITEAAWFSRGNLPEYPLSISIAGEMIGKFDRDEL